MSQTTLSPDDAAAHMYPSDLERFEFGEHTATAFSIAVGCPDERSQPLFTTDQAEAYAADRVREALEEAINLSSMYGATIELDAAIRALIPSMTTKGE